MTGARVRGGAGGSSQGGSVGDGDGIVVRSNGDQFDHDDDRETGQRQQDRHPDITGRPGEVGGVGATGPRPEHSERAEHQTDHGGDHEVVMVRQRPRQRRGEQREPDDAAGGGGAEGHQIAVVDGTDHLGVHPDQHQDEGARDAREDHGADRQRAGEEEHPPRLRHDLGGAVGDLGVTPQPEEEEERDRDADDRVPISTGADRTGSAATRPSSNPTTSPKNSAAMRIGVIVEQRLSSTDDSTAIATRMPPSSESSHTHSTSRDVASRIAAMSPVSNDRNACAPVCTLWISRS